MEPSSGSARSGAGGDGVAEPAEVRLLPLTHHLKVQGLLAEVALRCGVGLQLEARLLPGLHQLLCNAQETDIYSWGFYNNKIMMNRKYGRIV